MRRHLRLIAALLLGVTLAVSGCGTGENSSLPTAGGSTSPSDQEAGLGSSDSGGSDSGSSDSRDEALLKVAQCLRDHGLDVKDPEPGGGIELSIDGGDREQADAAMKVCEKYAPVGETDPEAERDEMTATAQCMRENGVEKFPDPKPGEGLHLEPSVAEDPDFAAAEDACMGGASTSSEGAP